MTSIDANVDQLTGVTAAGAVWVLGELTGGRPIQVAKEGMTWTEATYQLVAWGDGAEAWWWGSEVWIPKSPLEVELFPFSSAERVWLTGGHACYTQKGRLFCFGRNDAGELGNGTTTASSSEYVEVPVQAAVGLPIVFAELSGARNYAIDVAGDAWTWGYREVTTAEPSGPLPAVWATISPAMGITRSSAAGCSWNAEGSVLCWGANPLNLLVHIDPYLYPPLHEGNYPPTPMLDLAPATKVGVGDDGPLCALKLDGTVWCRGWYGNGAKYFDYDTGEAARVYFGDAP